MEGKSTPFITKKNKRRIFLLLTIFIASIFVGLYTYSLNFISHKSETNECSIYEHLWSKGNIMCYSVAMKTHNKKEIACGSPNYTHLDHKRKYRCFSVADIYIIEIEENDDGYNLLKTVVYSSYILIVLTILFGFYSVDFIAMHNGYKEFS